MDEVDDEEFQTLADLMDEETLRGDYFGGGVFLLLDETYTIDRNGNGEYRVYEDEEQVLTNAGFDEVESLLRG
jgi:hypothetical protein